MTLPRPEDITDIVMMIGPIGGMIILIVTVIRFYIACDRLTRIEDLLEEIADALAPDGEISSSESKEELNERYRP